MESIIHLNVIIDNPAGRDTMIAVQALQPVIVAAVRSALK